MSVSLPRGTRALDVAVVAVVACAMVAPPLEGRAQDLPPRPRAFYTLRNAPGAAVAGSSFLDRLLDAEASQDLVTPEMHGLLGRLQDRARATIARPDAPTEAEARRVLGEIHRLLTEEGFVYPAEGVVGSLSEALTPISIGEAEYARLRRVPENRRRTRALAKRPTGPFYIADCDLLSFLYLGVADVLDLSLRFMERQRTFNGDAGHSWIRWDFGDGRTLDWDPSVGEPYPRGALVDAPLSDDELSGYLWSIVGDNHMRAWAFRRARDAYETSLRLRAPNRSLAVLNAMAWMYATSPDPTLRSAPRALEYARAASAGAPSIGAYLDTLAAALAASGDFPAALATECRALAVETDEGSKAAYRRAARLYASGKPLLQERPAQAEVVAACLRLFGRSRGRAALPGAASVCFLEDPDLSEVPCPRPEADRTAAVRSR
jgi:tetratricopeptide (TPR) repeat protein